MITNDDRRTCEIKSRIVMAKAAFNEDLLTNKRDLNLNKLSSDVLHLEHSFE
jgi:hypothetical protein